MIIFNHVNIVFEYVEHLMSRILISEKSKSLRLYINYNFLIFTSKLLSTRDYIFMSYYWYISIFYPPCIQIKKEKIKQQTQLSWLQADIDNQYTNSLNISIIVPPFQCKNLKNLQFSLRIVILGNIFWSVSSNDFSATAR